MSSKIEKTSFDHSSPVDLTPLDEDKIKRIVWPMRKIKTVNISIQKIPVDLLLSIGKFLPGKEYWYSLMDDEKIFKTCWCGKNKRCCCSDLPCDLNDIYEITFAGFLNDYEMLEHYMRTYTNEEIIHSIIFSGNVKMLKWIIEKRDTIYTIPMYNCSSFHLAAYRGSLSMVKFLHDKGCSWDTKTCSSAAMGGHLKILQYLYDNDCPWDKETCYLAAEFGHKEVLKWAIDVGAPEPDYSCDYSYYKYCLGYDNNFWKYYYGIGDDDWFYEYDCYSDSIDILEGEKVARSSALEQKRQKMLLDKKKKKKKTVCLKNKIVGPMRNKSISKIKWNLIDGNSLELSDYEDYTDDVHDDYSSKGDETYVMGTVTL